MTKRKTEDVLKEQEAQARATRENAVAKASGTALTADGSNPWTELSAELDRFVGAPFVKFSKAGDFEISESESIPAGTKVVGHADEAVIGWRKWLGSKLVETRAGRVADRFVPAPRASLGDTDERDWEVQDDGSRKDPWQFYAALPLGRCDTGEAYLFSTSSKGGLRAVNGVLRAYGQRVRAKGDAAGLPIIELQPDSYKHRTFGKIFIPQLHVVGWTGADGKPLSAAADLEDEVRY
jgi:hypothetical protein